MRSDHDFIILQEIIIQLERAFSKLEYRANETISSVSVDRQISSLRYANRALQKYLDEAKLEANPN